MTEKIRALWWRLAVAIALAAVVWAGQGGIVSAAESAAGWQEVSLDQSDLDLPLRLPVPVIKLEKQIRDNYITQNRYQFGGIGRGVAISERVGSGFYAPSQRDLILSRDAFVEAMTQAIGSTTTDTIMPVDIVHKTWKIGHWGYVRSTRGYCLFAQTGYRLGGPLGYRNDRSDNFDTVLFLLYCEREAQAAFAIFEDALTQVHMIDDRNAYREALHNAGKLKTP